MQTKIKEPPIFFYLLLAALFISYCAIHAHKVDKQVQAHPYTMGYTRQLQNSIDSKIIQ